MPAKIIIPTGTRFGKLTIIEFAESRKQQSYFRCACDCGNELITSAARLKDGRTRSCGCLRREVPHPIKHGLAGTRIWRHWQGMRRRCFSVNTSDYPNYGGRGITACPRWNDFKNFLADMGYPPTDGHTLDRVDVNGNYEPSNCRWATRVEQARNKRNTKRFFHDGQNLTSAEWGEKRGFSPSLVLNRVRDGWSIADAINRPHMAHIDTASSLRLNHSFIASPSVYVAKQTCDDY